MTTLALDYAEDVQMQDRAQPASPLKMKKKGRGFTDNLDKPHFAIDHYDTIESDTLSRAQKSVEGWIVLVTNIHQESTEEDVSDKFAEFGEILNLHLNLDRRNGFVKGYALIEFKEYEEAKAAIEGGDRTKLLGSEVMCDFAFVKAGDAVIGEGKRREEKRREIARVVEKRGERSERTDGRLGGRRDERRGDDRH